MISLRPVGAHAAIRRAAAAHGARVLALSPLKLVLRDDAATRRDLRTALACARVVFTSPVAVRAALTLQPLRARRGQAWFAVGAGTAAALHRAGITEVLAPQRMDSEGLLALPGLCDVGGTRVGIVTAPGGRDRIVPALRDRGAQMVRADVYARVAVPLSPRAVAALRTLDAPIWLALSSGEALEWVLGALPIDALAILRRARVIAASARLAALAQTHGFADVTIAASAQPRDLLTAAAQARVRQQER